MAIDFNSVYLVGIRKPDTQDQWEMWPGSYQFVHEAEAAAEQSSCNTGIRHYVFKAISYYDRDDITASKTGVN